MLDALDYEIGKYCTSRDAKLNRLRFKRLLSSTLEKITAVLVMLPPEFRYFNKTELCLHPKSIQDYILGNDCDMFLLMWRDSGVFWIEVERYIKEISFVNTLDAPYRVNTCLLSVVMDFSFLTEERGVRAVLQGVFIQTPPEVMGEVVECLLKYKTCYKLGPDTYTNKLACLRNVYNNDFPLTEDLTTLYITTYDQDTSIRLPRGLLERFELLRVQVESGEAAVVLENNTLNEVLRALQFIDTFNTELLTPPVCNVINYLGGIKWCNIIEDTNQDVRNRFRRLV